MVECDIATIIATFCKQLDAFIGFDTLYTHDISLRLVLLLVKTLEKPN